MGKKRVRLFANGTQFMDWEKSNCERCQKYSDDGTLCELTDALTVAMFTDGTVSQEHARRLGYDSAHPLRYGWMCTEVVWTDEWREECTKDLPF